MTGIGIIETAKYLPNTVNTNEDVCNHVQGLTPEWILEKTGIKKRYHALPKIESASFMANIVAKKLLLLNGYPCINPKDIGLIIIASFSQDYMLPPLSASVHKGIGAPKDCQILDINTNCTGLIAGTSIAVERMMVNPKIKFAMVIGVEILSWYVNKEDKFTAPFFSDGAGGVLLGRVAKGYGHLNSAFCTDSSAYEDVRLQRGGFIEHNGKETWTQAITNVPYAMKELCHKSHIAMRDVDFFIFHQANKVMINYIMDKHRIPHEKTYTNVEEIGNTGAASIGIALDEAYRKGFIKSGNLLMLAGVGAGFNFGANLWKIQ
jgi:3-oxoacyl-[acyl-carrier-protein] synthase-3